MINVKAANENQLRFRQSVSFVAWLIVDGQSDPAVSKHADVRPPTTVPRSESFQGMWMFISKSETEKIAPQ